MKSICASLALVALLFVAADDPNKADLDALQGTWQAVSAEASGEKLPAEGLKQFMLVFDGKKIKAPGNRVSTFELETDKKPKVIVLTPQDGPQKGKAQRGIYELDKDSLKLCINNVKQEAAKEFATKKGDGFTLFVLKRQPAKKSEK